jgi:Fic family protein
MIPPFFTSQPEWLEKVERIYALVERAIISEEQAANPVELRRSSRVSAVHSSTVIEGNRLSLAQARAVVDGATVFGPERDVIEMQNAWAAYEALDSYDPYSVEDFLRAHQTLTSGLITEAGVFRTVDVEVVNSFGEVLHTGTQVKKVPGLVAEALDWARS